MRNGDFIAAIEQFLGDQACCLAIVFDTEYFFADVGHDPIWLLLVPQAIGTKRFSEQVIYLNSVSDGWPFAIRLMCDTRSAARFLGAL
jgi:hypothetical protein